MSYKYILAISTLLFGQNTLFAQTNQYLVSNSAIINNSHTESFRNDSTQNKKPDPTVRMAPWFVERFTISAGFFVPINNTNIRVSATTNNINAGTDVDFEDDLGFDKRSQTFMAGAQWRIARRSRLDFAYYKLDRSAKYRLDRDITFGDNTYAVNAEVNSYFNTDIYRLSYGYAILAKPTFELGLSIGAHVLGADTGISYAGGTSSAGYSDDFGFTAPLPNFGLWGGYEFGKRWAITGEIDYLAITIKDIKGRILGGNLNVKYKILKNLDASIGYTGLNFRVDVKKEKANGSFKWGYNGPAVAASFWFGGKKWLHN